MFNHVKYYIATIALALSVSAQASDSTSFSRPNVTYDYSTGGGGGWDYTPLRGKYTGCTTSLGGGYWVRYEAWVNNSGTPIGRIQNNLDRNYCNYNNPWGAWDYNSTCERHAGVIGSVTRNTGTLAGEQVALDAGPWAFALDITPHGIKGAPTTITGSGQNGCFSKW